MDCPAPGSDPEPLKNFSLQMLLYICGGTDFSRAALDTS